MNISKLSISRITAHLMQIESSSKKIWCQNKTLIVYSFFVALLTYGYEISNFTLSIDEETFLSSPKDTVYEWLTLGRWATYLLYTILFNGILLPFLPTLIAILGIVISVILFLNTLDSKQSSKLIFSTIAISLPIHAYYLAFNMINAGIGVGLIVSALSFICLTKALKSTNPVQYLAYATILFAISAGFYQSLISVFLFMICAWLFNSFIRSKITLRFLVWRVFFFSLIVSLLGFILNKIIGSLAIRLFLDQDANYMTDYFNYYFQWNKSDYFSIIIDIIRVIVGTLIGLKFTGGIAMWPVILFILLSSLLIWKKKNTRKERFIGLIILFLLTLTPFVFIIFAGGSLPDRTLIAVPYLAGYFWLIILEHSKYFFNRVLFFIGLLILVNNTATTTGLFFSCYNASEADRDMANRIVDEVYTLDLDNTKVLHPIAFIGQKDKPTKYFSYYDDIFGTSFFLWDKGNPKRILDFMSIIGINEFVPANNIQYQNAIENSKSMPSWPYQGSIVISDSVVIVKLSDP